MDVREANLRYELEVSRKTKRGTMYHEDWHSPYNKKRGKGKYKNHRRNARVKVAD